MKFHWGVIIFLFYGLFVAGIISMVAFYIGQDVDLVSKEYYNDEIRYQKKIEKLKRTSLLSEQVKFDLSGEKLNISFPQKTAEKISGEMLFSRPSDLKYDFRLALQTDSKFIQSVDFHGKKKGLWKLEVNWKAGNTEYLTEKIINFQ